MVGTLWPFMNVSKNSTEFSKIKFERNSETWPRTEPRLLVELSATLTTMRTILSFPKNVPKHWWNLISKLFYINHFADCIPKMVFIWERMLLNTLIKLKVLPLTKAPFTLSVSDNAAITLVTLFALKTMESLQNGLQPHFMHHFTNLLTTYKS